MLGYFNNRISELNISRVMSPLAKKRVSTFPISPLVTFWGTPSLPFLGDVIGVNGGGSGSMTLNVFLSPTASDNYVWRNFQFLYLFLWTWTDGQTDTDKV